MFFVRRHVPESPRWLFIHGREDEAEQIVGGIEESEETQTSEDLPEPEESLTVRQRKAIPFREIAKVAFKTYPKRSILGLALFIGQAFMYNGVTFDLGTLLNTFYDITAGAAPFFIAAWAISNFLGPVLLGHFFDSVGRKPMIAGTYINSAVLAVVLLSGSQNVWLFMAILMATFFVASAGASSAYLTVSEIFPMETRALAIAFFYAIGTAIGGIIGPLLFGSLIATEDRGMMFIAFFIGAAVMALGGVVEILFGVKAERATLEDIALPLTATDAESDDEVPTDNGKNGQNDDASRSG